MPRGEGLFEPTNSNLEDRHLNRGRGHVQRNEPNGGRIRSGRKKLMGARCGSLFVVARWRLLRGVATLEGAGQHALGVTDEQSQS